jgi:predicted phosphodiesterase
MKVQSSLTRQRGVTMQNTLIIGDIHGCYYELQTLLDKAGLGAGDAVIGIGDNVDRGPETPQVVDFFRTTPNAMAIMGNICYFCLGTDNLKLGYN